MGKNRLNLFGKENTSKKKSKSNVILDIVQLVLILVLVAVALASFGTKVPFLARLGINFFAVTSGSMEPKIPVGSLIHVRPLRLPDLKEGDVVTYRVDADGGKPVFITHRIVKVNRMEEPVKSNPQVDKLDRVSVQYEFTTKGDANNQEDGKPVTAGQIVGLYDWHLPWFGKVTMFAQSAVGFVSLVIVPAIILIVWEIVSLVLHFKSGSSIKSESEIQKLKAELATLKNK